MAKSNSGRPLPPLLPLEYCTLARASRLLECEVEDLVHWALIGAVKLSLRPDEIDQPYFTVKLPVYNKIKQLIDPAESVTSLALGMSALHFNTEDFLIAEQRSGFISFPGISISGIWRIEFPLIGPERVDKDSDAFNPLWLFSDNTAGVSVVCHTGPKARFRESEVLITYSELKKLHTAITTGTPLKSKYNDADIANSIAQNNELISATKPERNSPGRAEATLSIVELALKALNLQIELVDDPYKLYSQLNDLLRKHKLTEIQITDRGFADMLDKAKSARAARQPKLNS